VTTCLYNRKTREVGADTQNTTPDGMKTRVSKIEELKNGWFFLGSGHNYTIGVCRAWAAKGFKQEDTPDWSLFLEDVDEYGFAVVCVDPKTNDVYMLDNEMVPFKILDDICGVGSGAAYGIGALLAGSSMERALEIAAACDGATSAPFEVKKIG